MSPRVAVVCAALAWACSAPAVPADLLAAEAYARAGKNDEALAAYAAATVSCRAVELDHQRIDRCTEAYLGRAELLVTLERPRDAVVAYVEARRALSGKTSAEAEATFRIGRILLGLGDERAAYRELWKVVTNYPGEAFAADAIKLLVADGRTRNARQLAEVLIELESRLRDSPIADNLLAALADLAEHDFGDRRAALAYYDRLAAAHSDTGFHDDALWQGARLARELGRPEGAARRLRALLDTREVAWGTGSYFSVYLDDAKLELGRVLRDDLGAVTAAIAAFTSLPKDYPSSILRDDALFERAASFARLGETARACGDLARLQERHPDSKYELEKAPELRQKLGCKL